ncbi:MAG: dephospho-CoA kinase [Acidimicrobiales bacterium]
MVIGLTGGIGTGKSSVARLLADRGAVVVDADDLARQVVEPGTPGYGAVLERFGPAVTGADGRLDRRALADVVFSDAAARADLEAIVHPAVEAARVSRLEAMAGTEAVVVVVVVPLLVEVGWDGADAVVVVDCPEEEAVRRVTASRGMAPDDVRRRMAAQASRADRLARADRVIPNDGSPADLEAAVDAAWQWIRSLPPPEPGSVSRHRSPSTEPG